MGGDPDDPPIGDEGELDVASSSPAAAHGVVQQVKLCDERSAAIGWGNGEQIVQRCREAPCDLR